MMVRQNLQCPYCRTKAATFFVSAGNGLALYKCNDVKKRNPCGRLFTAAHPLPLRRDMESPIHYMQEAA